MDGASLLAAAIRAAVQAKAPRRTVQAVAAAVTGVLLRATDAVPADAVPHLASRRQPDAPMQTDDDGGDPAQLLASLRAARRSQRQRKKERKRAAKQAAGASAHSQHIVPHHDGDTIMEGGVAGPRAEHEGAPAAAPAQTPARPPDLSPPIDQSGFALQLQPAPAASTPAGSVVSSLPNTLRPSPAPSSACEIDRMAASETASAGRPRPSRSRSSKPKSTTQSKPRQR